MTTILDLHAWQFDVRVALGGCLMNIDGETVDVTIARDPGRSPGFPTYTVRRQSDSVELCVFRPYHLVRIDEHMFQVLGVSRNGAEGTLVVPSHGLTTPEPEDGVPADWNL